MLVERKLQELGLGSGTGSSADRAFEAIYAHILEGRLAPGESVTEEALGCTVAVSRTPLREAIRRLEMAGLLVRRRNRSLRVAELSIDEMLRLSMLREALEGVLVRHVTTRYANGEISLGSLESLVEQMETVDSENGLWLLLRIGRRFHTELSALSGDDLGARLLEQVLLNFERYRYLIDHDRERGRGIADEHRTILHAVCGGVADVAAAVMCRHIQKAREAYMERLSNLSEHVIRNRPEKIAQARKTPDTRE